MYIATYPKQTRERIIFHSACIYAAIKSGADNTSESIVDGKIITHHYKSFRADGVWMCEVWNEDILLPLFRAWMED